MECLHLVLFFFLLEAPNVWRRIVYHINAINKNAFNPQRCDVLWLPIGFYSFPENAFKALVILVIFFFFPESCSWEWNWISDIASHFIYFPFFPLIGFSTSKMCLVIELYRWRHDKEICFVSLSAFFSCCSLFGSSRDSFWIMGKSKPLTGLHWTVIYCKLGGELEKSCR